MFDVMINDGRPMLDSDIVYIICNDGIYLKKKVGLIESITKVDKISFLKNIKPYAILKINKINAKLFYNVVEFFKNVYENFNHCEANIILLYNQASAKFDIQVPLQKATPSSVDYINESVKGFQRIGTIHSHPHFSAFHSSTDINDEKDFDGIHITIGNITDNEITITCSLSVNGSRFTCDPINYIDGIVENKKVSEIKSRIFEVVDGQYVPVDKVETRISTTYSVNKPKDLTELFPSKWLENIDKFPDSTENKGLQQSNFWTTLYKDNAGSCPCDTCIYRELKSDLLLQDMLENMDDDELDSIGISDEVDDSVDDSEDDIHNYFPGGM